jgi:hypothetical protein
MRHLKSFADLFLQTHPTAVADGSTWNINVALDRQALQLYEQAEAAATQRLKNKKQPPSEATIQRLVQQELAVRLTALLSHAALNDETAYRTFQQAVRQWSPWAVEAQSAGQQVRDTMLSLLPIVRKKQQLQTLCNDYRDHLAAEIQDHLKNDHPKAYAQLCADQSRVFGAPPFENGEPRAFCIDSRAQAMDRFVQEQATHLPKPSVALAKAVEKYRAVTQLTACLQTPIQTAAAQIQAFSQQFSAAKPVIEQDRDSWAMTFLKGVATVFSLGAAILCGIWRVKGQAVTQNIETTLAPPLPVPACRVEKS